MLGTPRLAKRQSPRNSTPRLKTISVNSSLYITRNKGISQSFDPSLRRCQRIFICNARGGSTLRAAPPVSKLTNNRWIACSNRPLPLTQKQSGEFETGTKAVAVGLSLSYLAPRSLSAPSDINQTRLNSIQQRDMLAGRTAAPFFPPPLPPRLTLPFSYRFSAWTCEQGGVDQ